MWNRIIWLFILFLLGRHLCFPNSPRYLELADSADFFIARENWPKAEDKIIEALRLEPANFSNSLLLANLGLVQANQGRYPEALKSLSLGLNLAPSSSVLLNNRAHVYLMMDSINLAIADIEKSLRNDSIQEWPLQTLAFLRLQENNNDEALRLFKKLQKNFPNNTAALTGQAAIAEKKGEIQVAKSLYFSALERNPEDDETRQAYIFLLISSEDYSGARNQIRDGLALNPENPVFYLLRGYLHRLNFRNEEAIADKKIALSKGIDPVLADQFIPKL